MQVKEERKRIKAEIKEGFRDQLKKSFEPIPELADELNEEEFETEEVSVTITELSTSELAKNYNWIGQNRPKYSDDEDDEEEKRKAAQDEEDLADVEEVPGMGLTRKKAPKSKVVVEKTAAEAIVEEEGGGSKWQLPDTKKPIKSKRELGVIVQKDAMRTLKNSKAFQQKQRLDQLKDRKKARKDKAKRIILQTKAAKKNGGHVNERKIKRRMKLKRKGKK